MREILFKAKRLDNGEWVEGFVFEFKSKIYITEMTQAFMTAYYTEKSVVDFNMRAFEIKPNTLCQYTGLTDKNGRKIWENDIVSNEWCFLRGKSIVKFGEYKDYHMPERYQCGNYGFFLEHMHQNDFGARKDILYFSCKCEVVGNIFDDKELLEVE